jgi:hypothetical protein
VYAGGILPPLEDDEDEELDEDEEDEELDEDDEEELDEDVEDEAPDDDDDADEDEEVEADDDAEEEDEELLAPPVPELLELVAAPVPLVELADEVTPLEDDEAPAAPVPVTGGSQPTPQATPARSPKRAIWAVFRRAMDDTSCKEESERALRAGPTRRGPRATETRTGRGERRSRRWASARGRCPRRRSSRR